MSNDAIPEGEDASTAEAPAGYRTVAQNRLDMLEHVAGRHNESIASEFGAQPAQPPAAQQPPAQQETQNEPPLTAAELGGEAPLSPQFDLLDSDKEAQTKVRVKIDGEERELTIAEVKRGYQKDAAASKRLEEAARRQRELDDREARLKEKEAALASSGGAPDVDLDGGRTSPAAPRTPEERAAAKRALLTAIYAGDDETAEKALDDLLDGRSQTTTQDQQVDLAAVTEQVKTQVKAELTVEQAMGKFASDFKDVVADPHLARVADSYLAEIQAGEPHLSLSEALVKAGNQTRAWVRSRAGVTTPPPAPNNDDKTRRKEGIDNLQSASVKATGDEGAVAESPADVIATMAANRGMTRKSLR